MNHKTIPYSLKRYAKNYLRNIAALSLCVIILMLALTGYSQKKSLSFHILRSGNKVGTVHFSETSFGGTDSLMVESNVRTKLVSNFIGYGREYAIFSNGILLQSSIYRQLNGDEKLNKQHRLDNGQYIISNKKNSKVMKTYPINYNMLSLCSKEPENIDHVYSNNYETFLPSLTGKKDNGLKINNATSNLEHYKIEEQVRGN